MSTKTAAKNQGAKAAESKTSKKVTTTNKSGKVIGVTIQENAESNTELKPSANASNGESLVSSTKEKNIGETKTATAVKNKSKKETQKKSVAPSKAVKTGGKQIRIASSCYHYYRHFLKEFLRSHVPSSRFQKAADSYQGHIMILETDKTKALKALEQWNKENPDTKELFWDVKK